MQHMVGPSLPLIVYSPSVHAKIEIAVVYTRSHSWLNLTYIREKKSQLKEWL